MSKLAFSSLAMLVVLCAPAQAQSGPSAVQYRGGESGYCPPDSVCVQSLSGGADDLSKNASKGTDAVNEAMGEPEVSASAEATTDSGDASAPLGSVPPGGAPTGSTGRVDDGAGGGQVGITKLPETGGVSPALLGSGLVMVALGLMTREVVGR